MANPGRVKVGIIGSGFEADIHAESFRIMPDEAEVVAVASPTPGNAERLARKHGIPGGSPITARCWPSRISRW
jgi:myo-inositol 2-dehydrogenase / D-chiro-inositol 1-dehydrogenase